MGNNEFPTTSWSLILAASTVDADRPDALRRLCEGYWYPVYAFVRRRGYEEPEAQDLTQSFFLRILQGRYLDRADPNRGRFRSFLLNSCKFFLSDEADRARTKKLGGGGVISIDFGSGERRYELEPRNHKTPEDIFERNWAILLLDRVTTRVREEFLRSGSVAEFERLKGFLLGQTDIPYRELARDLGTTEGRLRVLIHRLRKRYRILFHEEIGATVSDPGEIDSEIQFLFLALRREE